MPTQEKDQMCTILVRKITTGETLDEAEKSHLAGCEDCMARIVKTFDEAARREAHNLETTGESNGQPTRTRPAAVQALEHGRRVFQREFGIDLSKK